MQRCIDNLQVVLTTDNVAVDRDGADFTQIRLVDVLADNLDKILVALELNVLDAALVDLVDNSLVMRGKYLCAILPVCLVTIVLAWVVACGNVYTTLSSKIADSESALRCRAKVVEEICLNAIG